MQISDVQKCITFNSANIEVKYRSVKEVSILESAFVMLPTGQSLNCIGLPPTLLWNNYLWFFKIFKAMFQNDFQNHFFCCCKLILFFGVINVAQYFQRLTCDSNLLTGSPAYLLKLSPDKDRFRGCFFAGF